MTGKGPAETEKVDLQPKATVMIHVQPRARRTEIVGWHGDAIKIRLAAPPVGGAANEELVRFLAARLRVSPARVQLAAGASRRDKRIEVAGLPPGTVLERLAVPQGGFDRADRRE